MCTVSKTDKLCIIRQKEEEKATERDSDRERAVYRRADNLIGLSFTIKSPDNLLLC
jgi:hypothetical protein